MYNLIFKLQTLTAETTTNTDVLKSIVEKTNSELIIFFVVGILGLLLAGIPIIRMLIKRKQQESSESLEEKKVFIEILKNDNKNVIDSFKSTLEIHNASIKDILQHIEKLSSEELLSINGVINRNMELDRKVDDITSDITTINTNLKKFDVDKLNELFGQNDKILSKLDKMTKTNNSIEKNLKELLENSNELIELAISLNQKKKPGRPKKVVTDNNE